MKKYILLTIIALSIVCSSCSKDPKDLIIGEWLNTVTYDIYDNEIRNYTDAEYLKYTFDENGKYVMLDFKQNIIENGDYYFSGDDIVIDGLTYEILKLSEKKLTMEFTHEVIVGNRIKTYVEHLEFDRQ